MLRRIALIWIFVFGFIWDFAPLLAQTYKFNTTPKGVELPVQVVLQIEQDTLGQMWFSTSRGVVYSDGIQTYTLPDTLTRKFGYKISIHKDEDGIFWLYNSSGSPFLVEGTLDGWQEIPFNSESKKSFSSGINFFSIGIFPEKYFFMDTRSELIFWKYGQLEKNVIPRDFKETGLLLSVINLDGKPLLNFQKGAFLLENNYLKAYKYRGIPLPSPPVMVKKSPSGDYYFLGESYLAKGPAAEFPVQLVDENFPSSSVNSYPYFSLDFSGSNVFYHYNSHLKRYNPARQRPLYVDLSHLFQTTYLQTLFVDREGILWLGTSRGLANNNSQIFQNYGVESEGFLGEEISAIIEVDSGVFLFGFNNGIQIFSRTGIETILSDDNPLGNPTQRIINFSKAPNGEILFSANWGGVGFYNSKSKRISLVKNKLAPFNVSSVQVFEDSVLITGPQAIYKTSIEGLRKGDFGVEISKDALKPLGDDNLFLRKAGKLKNGKTIILRASRLENQYPIQETGEFVLAEGYDYLELPDGSLLLGTEYGLKVYKEGYVGYYIYAGKSITHPVYAIILEDNGCIWTGTDNGVYVLGKGKFHNFNESSGLVGDEINRGALIQASSGRILIGTQKGLSIYFKEESFFAKGAPSVYLKNVVVGNHALGGPEIQEFESSENSLKVEFLAPAFNESKKLWIHYRLAESDTTAWQVIKDPRTNELFFTNLPAGEYRFELKASYDGEQFSETISSSPFVILRPFYLRPWFLVLAIMILIGIGFLINVLVKQVQNLGILRSEMHQKSKDKILAEQQFKNVWNSTQDGMILILDENIILTANPAFAKMMGMKAPILENTSFKELFDPRFSGEEYQKIFNNKLKEEPGKGHSLELPIHWKSGVLEMEVFSVLLEKDFSGKELILCVFKDITSQKQTEKNLKDAKDKAEEANRFKSSLLSNISHEIRTPLNGILGGTEHIMMIRKDDASLQSMLDIILQSGERLLDTITSLLDLAKIEANKMPVVYKTTDINGFVSTICQPLIISANRKGLELELVFGTEKTERQIDRRFVEIILNNLLSNSIKYTEIGKIKLTVCVQDDFLLLEVKDTGIGMSKEFQQKMFDAFEQESTGHDRLYDGFGLGLSITKNLVNLLNGQIEIWSNKAAGTRVLVTIPLPEA